MNEARRVVSHTSRRAGPFLTALILLLAAFSDAAAQDVSDRGRWWVGLGIGGGHTPDDARIITTLLQATYQNQGHQLSLRVPYLNPRHTYERAFREYGLSYGRVMLRPSGHLSASGGLSYVNACIGSLGSAGLPDACTGRWGIPLVAEGALHLDFIGVGLQGFANLNSAGTYTGIALFLQIGRLR